MTAANPVATSTPPLRKAVDGISRKHQASGSRWTTDRFRWLKSPKARAPNCPNAMRRACLARERYMSTATVQSAPSRSIFCAIRERSLIADVSSNFLQPMRPRERRAVYHLGHRGKDGNFISTRHCELPRRPCRADQYSGWILFDTLPADCQKRGWQKAWPLGAVALVSTRRGLGQVVREEAFSWRCIMSDGSGGDPAVYGRLAFGSAHRTGLGADLEPGSSAILCAGGMVEHGRRPAFRDTRLCGVVAIRGRPGGGQWHALPAL